MVVALAGQLWHNIERNCDEDWEYLEQRCGSSSSISTENRESEKLRMKGSWSLYLL